MTFRGDLDPYIPRLRRYACGLVSGQPAAKALADDLVRATLASRGQIGLIARWLDLEVELYALLTRIHRDAVRTGSLGACRTIETGHFCARGSARPERSESRAPSPDKVSRALADLPLEEREALLLVAVEGFRYARSARILKVSRRVLIARLCRARAAIALTLHTSAQTRNGKPRPAHLRVVE